jgi:hypothetical protein
VGDSALLSATHGGRCPRFSLKLTIPFATREQCDQAVETLRRLMTEGGPYGTPRHSSGTYWVEVRSGDLLCESIPLRSAEEALDLLDDSPDDLKSCLVRDKKSAG